MFNYMYKYVIIGKNAFEVWKANNDEDNVYVGSLTPDETAYIVPYLGANTEQETLLKSLNGRIAAFDTNGLKAFSKTNALMFTETGDGNPPVSRGQMLHPSEQDLAEFANLYDGTTATMNFNNQGDSTWVIPYNCLPSGGLGDVDKADNIIRLKTSKFGPSGIPENESRYTYIGPDKIILHTYDIVSVQDNNGTITVTLDIPANP